VLAPAARGWTCRIGLRQEGHLATPGPAGGSSVSGLPWGVALR